MKILGIDPGMARLGWSVIETSANGRHIVKFGCIETSSSLPLTQRLTSIYSDLIDLTHLHQPNALALETLFFVKNAKTLAQVGHVRGIILLVAGQNNLPVSEYAPRQIKMALTGSGAADKRQMQTMVQRMLGLKDVPKPDDAADAVAVALCHLQYAPVLGRSALTV